MLKKAENLRDDFDFTETDIKIKIAQFGGVLILSNGSRIKVIDAREIPYIKEKFGIEKFLNVQQSQLQELWSAYSY